MPDESYGASSRERVAPNVYRRTTRSGGVRFEVVFRDVDRRQRWRRLAATSERAAIREARALLARRDGGDRVVPAALTVRDFAEDDYLPLLDSLAAAGRRSERGVGLVRDAWRLYVEPALGDLTLGAVEGSDVAAVLRGLRERGLSAHTCRNMLTMLGGLYRLARARKIVTRSPLDELDPAERPRPQNPQRRRLDERALDALVRHASEPYRIGVALLALTGMRLSEALALRWRDVDLVELELHVSGQLTRSTREKPARIKSRKADAPAYTTLILPLLESELTRRLELELAAGRGQEDDFVCAMPRTGRPPHQRSLTDAVSDAALSAGFGHVTPQTLRRSFASIAARRIPDPAEAAHMTGHSLDVWVRHYVGRFGADARADARKRLLDAGLGAAEPAGPLAPRSHSRLPVVGPDNA